ncbi:MAG: hypothetical protein WBR29_00535 [Gammaproteobacteria bacterium]
MHTTVAPPKSIGHGKVMPPAISDRKLLATYLLHMAEKVGARLRKHHMQAQTFFIGFLSDEGFVAHKFKSPRATDDGREIYALCKIYLNRCWTGWGAHQVQVTALDPRPADTQDDLFLARDERAARRNAVMDVINARYGEFALAPAMLLKRSDMPNVISPAWKPYGHRQTI